jgi:hypothetical protein
MLYDYGCGATKAIYSLAPCADKRLDPCSKTVGLYADNSPLR